MNMLLDILKEHYDIHAYVYQNVGIRFKNNENVFVEYIQNRATTYGEITEGDILPRLKELRLQELRIVEHLKYKLLNGVKFMDVLAASLVLMHNKGVSLDEAVMHTIDEHINIYNCSELQKLGITHYDGVYFTLEDSEVLDNEYIRRLIKDGTIVIYSVAGVDVLVYTGSNFSMFLQLMVENIK